MSKRKGVQEDFDQEKYFEDLEEPVNTNLQNTNIPQVEEQDPLDAFMRQIDQNPGELDKQITKQEKIFQADPVDDYLQHFRKSLLKQQKINKKYKQTQDQLQQNQSQSDVSCEYINQDGEIDLEALRKRKKKKIQTLDPVDFSQIKLSMFQKNFYNEHPDIASLSQAKIKSLRKDWNMKVSGQSILKPIVSFGQLGFSEELIDLIAQHGFQKPTPIQCQALPICMSGRDIVGVAKTGSGKTLAYVWPLIIHILDQPELEKGDGPIGLILAPTRQLCQQIYIQTKKYSKKFDIKVGCLLGGENKHEQWKLLKAGVDILIASPGRLIQMIKKKATNLLRVTYLVIDEADKMFSYGFQQQLNSIMKQTRQDRQTLLFTATLRKNVQALVYDHLIYPAIVTIGEQNEANQDIQQEVIVLQSQDEKCVWLLKNLHLYLKNGKILIFVNQIKSCQKVEIFLKQRMNIHALVLHGDKTQYERTSIINSFKTKDEMTVLIGTDVASRGLDVRQIKTVINFQVPKDIDTYIHRIGRTGRAGDIGLAITLLLSVEHKFAIQLIKVFQTSSIPVPDSLDRLANTDDKYRVKRLSHKMGVSFAKGRDATKLLNQSLRRQRKSNVKAGIGYVQPDLIPKAEREPTFQDIYKKYNDSRKIDSTQKPLTIGELHSLVQMQKQKIKNQNSCHLTGVTKFDGRFVGGKDLSDGKNDKITITYYHKGTTPQSRNI